MFEFGRWQAAVLILERLYHRTHGYLRTHLAFVAAMFNILLGLFHSLHPAADPFQLSIAEFSL